MIVARDKRIADLAQVYLDAMLEDGQPFSEDLCNHAMSLSLAAYRTKETLGGFGAVETVEIFGTDEAAETFENFSMHEGTGE